MKLRPYIETYNLCTRITFGKFRTLCRVLVRLDLRINSDRGQLLYQRGQSHHHPTACKEYIDRSIDRKIDIRIEYSRTKVSFLFSMRPT